MSTPRTVVSALRPSAAMCNRAAHACAASYRQRQRVPSLLSAPSEYTQHSGSRRRLPQASYSWSVRQDHSTSASCVRRKEPPHCPGLLAQASAGTHRAAASVRAACRHCRHSAPSSCSAPQGTPRRAAAAPAKSKRPRCPRCPRCPRPLLPLCPPVR